ITLCMNLVKTAKRLAALAAVAALLSAAIALFISSLDDVFYFEVSMRSSQRGTAQLFYDAGRGFNEADSAQMRVRSGESASVYRFALRPAEYRAFRFDPIEQGAGEVTIYHAVLLDKCGHIVRSFPLDQFVDYHNVSRAISAATQLDLILGVS